MQAKQLENNFLHMYTHVHVLHSKSMHNITICMSYTFYRAVFCCLCAN